MPPNFDFSNQSSIWLPLVLSSDNSNHAATPARHDTIEDDSRRDGPRLDDLSVDKGRHRLKPLFSVDDRVLVGD